MTNLGLIAGLIGGTTVMIGVCVAVAAYNDGYHEIEDGYVGVYFKHGVLQDEINGRGEHYKQPFVTNVTSVIIRPEVANISDVEAVTKDGVTVTYQGIAVLSKTKESEVVNLIRQFGMDFKKVLIYDRIKEDVRLYCANKPIEKVYTDYDFDIVPAVRSEVKEHIKRIANNGVKILNLVIPKPDIQQEL